MKICPRLKRHKVVLRNLELCFPNMFKDERADLAIKTWGNLGAMLGEMLFWKLMSEKEFKKRVTIKDDVGAFCKGAKFVVVSHFSNFEVFTTVPSICCLHIHCLYSRPKNSFFDKILYWLRERPFMHLHRNSGHEGIKAFINGIKQKHIIGMYVDQNAPNGIPTTFFNLPVKTTDLAAKLSLKYNCPIYMARIIRTGTAKYEVETQKFEVLESDTSDSITQKMNDIIEGWIREYPEQYYWVHRRFKLVGYPKD
jgi:KDO2-lipid IV(A) lauroyltransferase